MYRIRALSQNEEIGKWTPLNPLFKEYVDLLECACNVGASKSNLENYVCREDNFEFEYAKKICIEQTNQVSKITTLYGYVGKGKTTFISFVREKIIHKEYPKIITIYIDLTALPLNPIDIVKKRLIKILENKIIKLFNFTSYDLMTQYLNFHGFIHDNQLYTMPILYKNHLTIFDLLEFLKYLSNERFNKIIFFFDNVDENKRETVSEVRYFIREIHSYMNENDFKISSLFLITVRDYNKKFFSDEFNRTNILPDLPLPEVNYIEVVKSILFNIQNEIKNAANEYTQVVYFDKYYRNEKNITITKDGLLMLLENFIDILFKNNNSVIDYLYSLSAGNLKILSVNILNILQSKNLPLSDLFDVTFSELSNKNLKMSNYEIIQLLMAIRYPYFDIEASTILNVFNVNSSHNRYDYFNVLLIPRMLYYIYNHRNFDLTFSSIRSELMKYDFNKELIDIAIDKCFGKGLFQTKFGVCLSQVDQENDFIKLGKCGLKYVEDLIFQFSYLQYVCEDTPVSPNEYIPIYKKYYRENNIKILEKEYKANRIQSVKNFLNFIEKLENLELKSVSEKGLDIEDYLHKFSFRNNGKGCKLSFKIFETVNPQINYIEKGNVF